MFGNKTLLPDAPLNAVAIQILLNTDEYFDHISGKINRNNITKKIKVK
jgi:hypothetical protein